MPIKIETEGAYDLVEICRQDLGIGSKAAYLAAQRGEIPAVKLAGRWVVPKPAWERFMRGEWKPETQNTPAVAR